MPRAKIRVLLIGDNRGREDLALLQRTVQVMLQRPRSERIECVYANGSISPPEIEDKIEAHRPHVIAFQEARGKELDVAIVAMSRDVNPEAAIVIFFEEHPSPHYLRFNGLALKGGEIIA
ncbi:MAG: hypothetical protein HW405_963 [Candidatus Berkelbacteria bacterium]|nr:hypothetical protein [Candidatus Berkelbacteria bacterium]